MFIFYIFHIDTRDTVLPTRIILTFKMKLLLETRLQIFVFSELSLENIFNISI